MHVMKRRRLVVVFVIALGCAQMLSLLTGAKTVSVCGAGACFTTASDGSQKP